MQGTLLPETTRSSFHTGPKLFDYPRTREYPEVLRVPEEATRWDIRRKICRLEYEMMRLSDKYTELPTEHLFAPGVYLRKCFIKRGDVVVGKLHKHEHSNIISQGIVSVLTEFEAATYHAYCMFTTPPGTKRALVALEDTIWTCVHLNPDNITDLDELEKLNIAKSYTELGWEDPVLLLEGER